MKSGRTTGGVFIMGTKVCTKCGIEYPATTEYYHSNKKGKYGLQAECKACVSDYHKQYRINNIEKLKEDTKKYYDNNIDKIKKYRDANKGKMKEYNKQYRISNNERLKQHYTEYRNNNRQLINEYKKVYYESNKDLVNDQVKIYRNKNREKTNSVRRISTNRRRACKRQLVNSYTLSEWQACVEYFDNKCAYCGNEEKLSQEHFVPLSKGGEYTKNNIIPSCTTCNSSKINKDFFEWYPKQLFYDKERERKILKYLNYDEKSKAQQLTLTL
jgi:hypothetical protein